MGEELGGPRQGLRAGRASLRTAKGRDWGYSDPQAINEEKAFTDQPAPGRHIFAERQTESISHFDMY